MNMENASNEFDHGMSGDVTSDESQRVKASEKQHVQQCNLFELPRVTCRDDKVESGDERELWREAKRDAERAQ